MLYIKLINYYLQYGILEVRKMKYVICPVCGKDFYLIGPEKYTKCIYCDSMCEARDPLIKRENHIIQKELAKRM